MRILIIEDEIRLAEALAQIMEEQGYEAETAFDGTSGLKKSISDTFDVIVLDVMLPGPDGFSVVRTLRQSGIRTPVLMLTARDDTSDKVAGLDCGADDYMTKPFVPEELLARIRALSRRQEDLPFHEVTFSDLVLDLSTGDLRRGERSVHLGRKEQELLKLFIRSFGKTLSKERILAEIWDSAPEAAENNVEAYISFLRKKLLFLESEASINTVRKVGYRLEGPGL